MCVCIKSLMILFEFSTKSVIFSLVYRSVVSLKLYGKGLEIKGKSASLFFKEALARFSRKLTGKGGWERRYEQMLD